MVALEGIDARHLVGSEFKIKDIVVFGNMLGIRGSGDGDDSALEVPAEQDLIGALGRGRAASGQYAHKGQCDSKRFHVLVVCVAKITGVDVTSVISISDCFDCFSVHCP